MKFKKQILSLSLIAVLILNLIYYKDYFYQAYLYYKLRNEHIVVSMTTTPYRIKDIEPLLQSVTNQFAPIKAIYLNIPHYFARDKLAYQIPDFILNDKRITILRTQDYGPATKLLGMLEKIDLPENSIIITVDDDVKYPKTLVLHLAYAALRYPNSVIGLRGANPVYTNDGRIDLTHELGHEITTQDGAIVSIMQGYSGVAYRRKFFKNDIFKITQAPQECYVSDDLYLSYYLAYNGRPRRVLRNRFMHACRIGWRTEVGVDEHALHSLVANHAYKTQVCLDYLQQIMPLEKF